MKSVQSVTLLLLLLCSFGLAAAPTQATEGNEPDQKQSPTVVKALEVTFNDDELSVCSTSDATLVIRVYDLSGVLVISKTSQETKTTVALNTLDVGTYYMAIVDGQGGHYSKSFEMKSQTTALAAH